MPKRRSPSTANPGLPNELLAHIVRFVLSHDNACEETDALITMFNRSQAWKDVAKELGWYGVSSRSQFLERCVRERQNRLVSQYDPHKPLTKDEYAVQSYAVEHFSSGWKDTNEWVVPGLVVHDTESNLAFKVMFKKGTTKVVLKDGRGDQLDGVAMRRTNSRGRSYMIRIKGKRYLKLLKI